MPLVLLGYGHVACIDKTFALLPSLWLSCGFGTLKTFEDVLLSIRSMNNHRQGRRGMDSKHR